MEKLDLTYPEKNLGGLGKILGACAPDPNVEPPLDTPPMAVVYARPRHF